MLIVVASQIYDIKAHIVYRFITKCGRATAEDATQVFGGRALTQSGMGKFIENVRLFFCRDFPLLIC
jgi:hypothetical protein